MNHYGAQVMRHWQAERLLEFQELDQPREYFTQLGEEIAEQVEIRARSLAGSAPAEPEGYLARLQRLNSARLEAEAEVVREYLLQESEQEPTP
ncbi:hypothetical protein [Streptomyces lydicus]|uniref:hypothetical protein n=1 Tax=Streptomyces lydicus TaxID=47763 RepID=UPI001010A2AA|nr:hypothetical protein [Streptomyces lydicus]MCZ1012126.1 hypothetical protein [Streptomyces lydicus]